MLLFLLAGLSVLTTPGDASSHLYGHREMQRATATGAF